MVTVSGNSNPTNLTYLATNHTNHTNPTINSGELTDKNQIVLLTYLLTDTLQCLVPAAIVYCQA